MPCDVGLASGHCASWQRPTSVATEDDLTYLGIREAGLSMDEMVGARGRCLPSIRFRRESVTMRRREGLLCKRPIGPELISGPAIPICSTPLVKGLGVGHQVLSIGHGALDDLLVRFYEDSVGVFLRIIER